MTLKDPSRRHFLQGIAAGTVAAAGEPGPAGRRPSLPANAGANASVSSNKPRRNIARYYSCPTAITMLCFSTSETYPGRAVKRLLALTLLVSIATSALASSDEAFEAIGERFVADLPKTSTGKVMRRELHTLDAD